MTNRLKSLLLLAVLFLSLSACGGSDGDDDETAPSGPTPTGAVSATISAEGGAVTVVTAERTTVTLTFPAGAVSTPLEVTLTPQTPKGGAWFAVGIEPSGMLLGAPLEIQVELPASIPDAEKADGVLQFAGASDTAVVRTSWNDGWLTGVSQSLGLPGFLTGTPATPVQAAKAAVRQAALSLPSPASVLRAIPMNFSTRLALAENLMTVLRATHRYRDALELNEMILTILESLGDPAREAQVRAWLDRMWGTACGGFADARANLLANELDGHPWCVAEAKRFEMPVASWVRILMSMEGATSATCAGFSDGAWEAEVSAHMGKVIAAQQADVTRMWRCDCEETPYEEWSELMQGGRCAQVGVSAPRVVAARTAASVPADLLTTEADWDHLADTVDRAQLIPDQLTYLGMDPTEEVASLVDPHFAFARELAWEGCRQGGSTMPVGKLLWVVPGNASLQEDGQYCGTVLDAQAQTTGGTVTAQLAEPLGGVKAGETNTDGTINADKGGKLALSGPIHELWCPATSTGGSEELTIKFDGTAVQTVHATPYISDPLEIDLTSALDAAHPEGTGSLTQAVVTVERTGAPCNGFWGDNPLPLAALTLAFSQPRIAFTRDGSIYSMNPDGSSVTQLTSGAASDIQPAWSAGRDKLAFARGVAGDYNIYVMNADGSNLTQLTTSAGTFGDYNPTWSPDGSMIAFQRYDASHNSHIYHMSADGSGVVQLTTSGEDNQDPTWSPDGTKIAFSRGRYDTGTNSPELSIMSSIGRGITNLTNDAETDLYPSWSPDSTKIVYSRVAGSSCAIYSVNADGTGQTQITTGIPCCNYYPVWSPDGTKIAFRMATDDSTQNGIYVINVDGSGLTRLTSGSDSELAW